MWFVQQPAKRLLSRNALLPSALFLILTFVTVVTAPAGNSTSPIAAPTGFTVKTASTTNLECSFSPAGLNIEPLSTDEEFTDLISLSGCEIAGPAGWPELPSVQKLVVIPPQCGVSVILADPLWRTIEGVSPRIRQPETLTDANAQLNREGSPAKAEIYVDSALGSYSGFWPPEVVTLGEPGIMRGNRIIPVTIHPVRWNPATGEMQVAERIDFCLDLTSDKNRTNPVTDPTRPRPSVYASRLLKQMVVNPEAVRDDPPARDDGLPGGSIAYVTGDWDNVVESLEPLLEWRRQMGWTANVIRVGDQDNRLAVKSAIQNAYDRMAVPPEFIVLVGDGPGLEGNDYTLAYYNEQHGSQYAYETDHHYAELEGNDIFPEAAVGRLVFNRVSMLDDIVDKIISYESDPYMGNNNDDVAWYLRGATAATDCRSGTSSIDMGRWCRMLMLRHGFTQVNELYWTANQQQRDPTDFINTYLRNGVSFFVYRGWSEMNGFECRAVDRINNGSKWPFVILATCNTGDYGQNVIDAEFSYTERFGYLNEGGAIGAVGAAGATHTAYNNILASGVMTSIFVDKVHSQGWALMAGKLQLHSHYADRGDINHAENNQMEAWLTEFYIYNLMGDPAVDLYTAPPALLNVSFPGQISVGQSDVAITVTRQDNRAPVAGARVCLYQAGEIQLVSLTDAAGMARFHFDVEEMSVGDLILTVTGVNLRAFQDEISVTRPQTYLSALSLAIDDDNNNGSQGDNDQLANNGERVALTVAISNRGATQPQGQMRVVLTCVSPWIDIVEGSAVLNAAPRAGQSSNVSFMLDIDPGYPHNTTAQLNFASTVGNSTWNSSLPLLVTGPDIAFELLDWDNNPLAPGDTCQAFLYLANVGDKDSPPLRVHLLSEDQRVGFTIPDADIRSIPAGDIEFTEDLIEIFASSQFIRGNYAPLKVIVAAENGFADTSVFNLRIDRLRSTCPFGPDAYGYICIDNSDTTWGTFPRYDWVEIASNFGGGGRNTNLVDAGEDQDHSVVVALPFEFTYYGQSFDRITICTNGWMSFGTNAQQIGGRNRHLPGAENIPGMLCPFWEDLVIPDGGGIFTWHDADQGRFIIEWSRLRKLGPNGPWEPTETFEAILYDPDEHPTETGDGEIVFQYHTIEDDRSCYQAWDTPFASVGIVSPDLRDGLEYTYWGQLNAGAAPLINGRAIKFTTQQGYITGQLTGLVREFGFNAPLSGVVVQTSYGHRVITDANGRYSIPEAIVADNYRITFSKLFYNDSTVAGFEIQEGANQLNVPLKAPRAVFDPERIEAAAVNQNRIETNLTISNPGSGWLHYSGRLRIQIDEELGPAEGDDDGIWRRLGAWAVSDSVEDLRLGGVVFCGDRWVVAGGANNSAENWFYVFNSQRRLINRLPQEVSTAYGVRDMTYYGGAIYCVYSGDSLLKIDPVTGAHLRSWMLPELLIAPRAIGYDPDSRTMFIAGSQYGIFRFRFEGDSSLTTLERLDLVDPRGNSVIHPYGLSWYLDDPDDCQLYIMTKDDPEGDVTKPDISIYKTNPVSGETFFLTGLEFLDSLSAGRCGIDITNRFQRQTWTMAALIDHPEGDYVEFFELGPDVSWISFTPSSQRLDPGEEVSITLEMRTGGLISGDYDYFLEFTHNASPGATVIPLSISIRVAVDEEPSPVPVTCHLEQNWPNPFNAVTSIEYETVASGWVKISVFDLAGREVATVVNKELPAGEHRVKFDGQSLAAGMYLCRMETNGYTMVRKMALLK